MNTLFDMGELELVEPVKWNEKVISLSYSDKEIIRWIMLLHNNGQRFDLDPTYSTGRFWEGLPQPNIKFDLYPQTADTTQADARRLPLADKGLDSIMFDPPFVVGPPRPGIIRERFGHYRDIPELWGFYTDALAEFWRVLRPGGIVAFKCQDIVSGGVNYMTHAYTISAAQEIGYYVKDLFVLGAQSVLWSPNMRNQQHARKTHSYFLVLQKPQRGRAARLSCIHRQAQENGKHSTEQPHDSEAQ